MSVQKNCDRMPCAALRIRTGAGCIVSMLTLVEHLIADVQFQPIGHVFLYREVPAAQIG
ncbi:hypothetical protein [Pseudomonas fluorescens]|uniref:hypothetical protein n=1 Tax=Pseudomonas fluorescens TaxID=294 RepID=UPI0012D3CFA5|nr:hypothetical protein [Pseudomonas fluorescens]